MTERIWGHDGDWCRDCQEGCAEEFYGGPCRCCAAYLDPENDEYWDEAEELVS
jgi:hypothetical protein